MATFEITVGRMLCGQVRRYLDKCKFKQMDIDYIESPGFIEREFTIRGTGDDMNQVIRDMTKWANENSK